MQANPWGPGTVSGGGKFVRPLRSASSQGLRLWSYCDGCPLEDAALQLAAIHYRLY
jgi:hypothetical protein